MMRTNAAALDIIKRNEGLRLKAYQDVVGVWTIGYGDTGPDVVPGLVISKQDAEQRLVDRLAREFEPGVRRAIGNAPTTENQFGAMVSLEYNIGVGAFDRSTVAKMHKAGNHQAAAEAFALWNKAGGRVYAGLVRRRQEEADLYLLPDTDSMPNAVSPLEKIKAIQLVLGVDQDGAFGRRSRARLNDVLRAAGQPGI
jgi:lysozyme